MLDIDVGVLSVDFLDILGHRLAFLLECFLCLFGLESVTFLLRFAQFRFGILGILDLDGVAYESRGHEEVLGDERCDICIEIARFVGAFEIVHVPVLDAMHSSFQESVEGLDERAAGNRVDRHSIATSHTKNDAALRGIDLCESRARLDGVQCRRTRTT